MTSAAHLIEPQPARRILVAEDDMQMRRLVADVLRKQSYEVEEISDGEQLSLRLAEMYMPFYLDPRFDLVISDVRMPFCSGLDVLEKLRVAGRPTPVLLMTAFGDRDLRDRVRDLGGMLIDKPFTPQALRDAVREMLARHPTH